jgi:hypothetical protein
VRIDETMSEDVPTANPSNDAAQAGAPARIGADAVSIAAPTKALGCHPSVDRTVAEIGEWAGRLPQNKPRVAIIVPYRDRAEHLQRFLPNLISFFHRDPAASQIQPIIIISEQSPGAPFNRGGVLNAGFLAVEPVVDYVCFHDVDFLPTEADYSAVDRPTRIIWYGLNIRPVRVGDHSRIARAPRVGLGAVTVCSKADFRAANGFSNRYFGWGFEDLDLMERLRLCGIAIGQKDGRFEPLDHDHAGFADDGRPNEAWLANESRYQAARELYQRDGAGHDGLSCFPFRLALKTIERVLGLATEEAADVIHLLTDIAPKRSRNKPTRENLVVVRCGAQSLHPGWLNPTEARNWDLLLCPYEPVAEPSPDDGVFTADVRVGPKWAGVSAFISGSYGAAIDWRDYRQIWLPDDDLVIAQNDINRLFDIAGQLGAQLCAPALHPSSYFSHPITMLNTEFTARRTTFVEIMMPCFATSALAALAATIDRSTTGYGWGLDFVWPHLLDFKDVYIVDAVMALHTRPVSSAPSEVYEDMAQLLAQSGTQTRTTVLGGYDRELAHITADDLAFRVKLIKGWAYLYAKWPVLFQRTVTDQGW